MQQKLPRVSSPWLQPPDTVHRTATLCVASLSVCIITDLTFQLCHNKNEPLQTRGSFPFLRHDKRATLSPFATWWPR